MFNPPCKVNGVFCPMMDKPSCTKTCEKYKAWQKQHDEDMLREHERNSVNGYVIENINKNMDGKGYCLGRAFKRGKERIEV